jgi:hypothetical protein
MPACPASTTGAGVPLGSARRVSPLLRSPISHGTAVAHSHTASAGKAHLRYRAAVPACYAVCSIVRLCAGASEKPQRRLVSEARSRNVLSPSRSQRCCARRRLRSTVEDGRAYIRATPTTEYPTSVCSKHPSRRTCVLQYVTKSTRTRRNARPSQATSRPRPSQRLSFSACYICGSVAVIYLRGILPSVSSAGLSPRPRSLAAAPSLAACALARLSLSRLA